MPGCRTGDDRAGSSGGGPNLLTRYLLLPATDGARSVASCCRRCSKLLFGAVAALAVLTLTVRMVTAEAISLRLGVFVYVLVSALILLLLLVVGNLGIAGVSR